MSANNREYLRLATVGTHLLASTLVGFAIGHQLLDPWLGTKPAFTVVFSLIGIAAGFLNLYREVVKLDRADEEARRREEAGVSPGENVDSNDRR